MNLHTKPNAIEGWSMSGKLRTFDASQKVSLQAKLAQPSVFTITFAVDKPDDSFVNPQADIQWSVAGNTSNRRVSIVDGLSFSGVGAYPAVKAYDALVVGQTGTNPLEYVLSVLIAPGTRPSQQQPPTLMPPTVEIDSGGAVPYQSAIVVPAGSVAKWLVPQGVGVISCNMTATFDDFSTIANGDYTFIQASPLGSVYRNWTESSLWVPMVPGVRELFASNNSAKNIIVSALFGVDG